MSDSPGIVDWRLARRVAGAVHGQGENPATGQDDVTATFATALDRVVAYSELEPAQPIPPAELVSRAEWARVNLGMMRTLAEPLERRAAQELGSAGIAGGLARRAVGAGAGTEAGLVLGYSARKVIGQYALQLTTVPPPARMLLVGANLDGAARDLHARRERFLLWVAIHEQTHAVQFTAVPWLHGYLVSLVDELIAAAGGSLDFGALLGRARELLGRDPRKLVRQVLRGELARALAGREQAAILDRLQCVMSVIEGHAEHVMDAAALPEDNLDKLRAGLDARRAGRAGLADAIARALGLGAKLRQYEVGKRFADAVVAEHGVQGLNRAWADPAALPDPEELEKPRAWAERVLSYAR